MSTEEAPAAQKPPAALVVVALVGVKLFGPLPGPSPRSLYRLDAVDQLFEDLRVVDLGPGEHRGERCAVPVDEQVAFRARSAPDEVHPLYAGLGADVVLQAAGRGHRLTADDFPKERDASKKRQVLVDRFLEEANKDVEYAVYSLAAARAFDRELFEKLGSWERSRYSATDAAFDTLIEVSFVWEAETRGAGWYSVHALLRRILRERGDDRLREADAALEEIYRERAEAGDILARAEVVYYTYQQDSERGLRGWVAAFSTAREQSRYALCEALRTVGTEFQLEDPWWRARIALEEGKYLLDRSRYAEADEALQISVAAYGEVLSRAPANPNAYGNKGNALKDRGDLLATLARHDEAEEAYTHAVEAHTEALSRAPDYIDAYNGKGAALAASGELLASLGRHDEAEETFAEAIAAFDEALSRSSDDIMTHLTKH